MVYVSAPIIKKGDEVKFYIELTGTVVDPGVLTREQNKLGLLWPMGEPVPEDKKTVVRHPVLGVLLVEPYWISDNI